MHYLCYCILFIYVYAVFDCSSVLAPVIIILPLWNIAIVIFLQLKTWTKINYALFLFSVLLFCNLKICQKRLLRFNLKPRKLNYTGNTVELLVWMLVEIIDRPPRRPPIGPGAGRRRALRAILAWGSRAAVDGAD